MKNTFPTPDLQSLPDDLASLKSLFQDTIKNFQEVVKDQNETIERLRHQLYLAARHRYGRKSEQISEDQLSIFLNEIEGKAGQPSDIVETETITYTRKKGHGRNPSVKDLPVHRVEHPLPEDKKTCPECQGALSKMGEDVMRTLEHIPAVTYIREDVLEKWACPHCKEAPVTSEGPMRPIERCLAGPGMLASVVTSKFADHLPLYRQAEIFERGGLEICRSTLCDWVGGVAGLLEPLYEAMKQDVLGSKVIHTDDTPVPYLDDGDEAEDTGPGKAKTGRLWVYSGDKSHANIVYDFTEDRKAERPKAFMGDWKGYLQADAYAGYDAMFKPEKAVEVACWAHARRKFNDAKDTDKKRSHEAMA